MKKTLKFIYLSILICGLISFDLLSSSCDCTDDWQSLTVCVLPPSNGKCPETMCSSAESMLFHTARWSDGSKREIVGTNFSGCFSYQTYKRKGILEYQENWYCNDHGTGTLYCFVLSDKVVKPECPCSNSFQQIELKTRSIQIGVCNCNI